MTSVGAFAAVAAGGVAGAAGSKPSSTSFDLCLNTPFLNCLAPPGKTPVAKVEVTRGKLNDQLELIWPRPAASPA